MSKQVFQMFSIGLIAYYKTANLFAGCETSGVCQRPGAAQSQAP